MKPSSQNLNHTDSSSLDGGLSIAAVERETGLGKDTLRVWERRYGFPSPARDSAGDRLYSVEQVQQLKLICRLLDSGMRPGKVVGLDSAELQALLAESIPASSVGLSTTKKKLSSDEQVSELLSAVGRHDPGALRHGLSLAQMRMGLAPFVTDLVAPLTTAVGDAWAQGQFEIYEEHLYTEVVTGVLRQAIGALTQQPGTEGPKVLLTTLPQEQHSLGLLMVEALLVLEGFTCVSLGTQTPVTDVAQAARAHGADIVALSFTNIHKASVVHNSLKELRGLLSSNTALWVGGSCTALYQRPLRGISTARNLSDLGPLVAQWFATH